MSIPEILLVEDEIRLCEGIAYLLRKDGYRVTLANCGLDAKKIVTNGVFDLAILDLHLPDMLGTEIMGDIKTLNPDTTVIIITGDADLDSALAALKYGAYGYLRKPFEFEELLNTIKHAIDQKLLEKEKNKINEQLSLSEKKYRYLVQNSPDIIYTLDSDGNFTFLSEAVEDLLGFSVDSLIGKHYSTIVYDEYREKAKWYFAERRSGHRASKGMELKLKVNDQFVHDDSFPNYLVVELKAMGIYESSHSCDQKQYVGTHGVIRDISERCRLQAQLQGAERMESIGTLAGGIAHDFNNLLMGIQGRSTLMSMDLEKQHPHWEHLQAIDKYVHSAKELTNQLLGFARGGKYEVKPTDINELIKHSAKMFGRTKKEIVIKTEFDKESFIVEVDRGQIEQVLLNLFVNAWQAMPNGGTLSLETIAVNLNEKKYGSFQLKAGRYVRISVADTGIGMSQQIRQRIFDPFFTTKDKGRGTGLGLASVYGIIKNHNGIIDVKSEIEVGTTFYIYLPMSKKAAENDIVPEQKMNNGSETILLVDDEELVINVGKPILEKLGYHVIAVKSGTEAIDVISSIGNRIDLVILDMIMPGMDGGKTYDKIREILPGIPVILSSGYAINGQASKIMKRGCKGFIQKPFNLNEISQKVRQILDSEEIKKSNKIIVDNQNPFHSFSQHEGYPSIQRHFFSGHRVLKCD